MGRWWAEGRVPQRPLVDCSPPSSSSDAAQAAAGGSLDLTEIRCSCREGTHGSASCNYGRACGTLKVRDIDVGKIGIAEGLAHVYICGADRCPKQQAWCQVGGHAQSGAQWCVHNKVESQDTRIPRWIWPAAVAYALLSDEV